MIHVNEDILKSVHSLQRNHSFLLLTKFIEQEYENNITGLLTASRDKLQPLQGRAAVLKELLSILKFDS